jgi:hypothetical protein
LPSSISTSGETKTHATINEVTIATKVDDLGMQCQNLLKKLTSKLVSAENAMKSF